MWLVIFVDLCSHFCPHMKVVIDLMLSKRLVNFWSLFIYFAVINILSMVKGAHIGVET